MRTPHVPLRGLFVGVGECEHRSLGPGRAADLQADGQSELEKPQGIEIDGKPNTSKEDVLRPLPPLCASAS